MSSKLSALKLKVVLRFLAPASNADVDANADAHFGVLGNQPSICLSTADMGYQSGAAGFDNLSVAYPSRA